jgi:hypothetical protein
MHITDLVVDKKPIQIGGRKLEESALGWGDLTVLAAALQTPKAPL